jgi:hypothetical protein
MGQLNRIDARVEGSPEMAEYKYCQTIKPPPDIHELMVTKH